MLKNFHILSTTTNQLIYKNRTLYYPLIIFFILPKIYLKALLTYNIYSGLITSFTVLSVDLTFVSLSLFMKGYANPFILTTTFGSYSHNYLIHQLIIVVLFQISYVNNIHMLFLAGNLYILIISLHTCET